MLKITPSDGTVESQGRTFREVEIDTGSVVLALTYWSDGVLEVATSDYQCREWGDERPFSAEKDDVPDVIMAITEFLGSL